jgi:hypothetical protein
LAGSLNNFANHQSATGDDNGGLWTVQEVVEIRRRLSIANPWAYGASFARFLAVKAIVHQKLGQQALAKSCTEEAIKYLLPLVQVEPGACSELLTKIEKLNKFLEN